MSDAYQAALTLRALHPDDRTWLLSQLSSAEKEAIEALVAHNDKGLHPVGEAHKFELAIAREELHQRSPDTISRLIALDATQIASVLEHEPDWLVAGILEAHRWPWHAEVLDLLGLERRKNIVLSEKSAIQPKQAERLLLKLYERARDVDTPSFPVRTSEPPSPTPKPRRLPSLEGIRKWLP